MSSSSLGATTLAASTSNSSGSSSPGHTSPSVSSLEEEAHLSGSEASFDHQQGGCKGKGKGKGEAKSQGRHADMELDAANMLSSLKHLPPLPRIGFFTHPSAPPTAAGGGGSGSPLPPPPALARASSLSLLSAVSSSSSFARATSLPHRPPAAATATLFPPSSSMSSSPYAPSLAAAVQTQSHHQEMKDEEEDDESLVIEGDEEDWAAEDEDEDEEQRSRLSRGAGAGKGKRKGTGTGTDGGERKAGCKWTAKEDVRLREGVAAVGERNWEVISGQFLHGLRSAIQCSHRWSKVLRPGLVKGAWTKEEDGIIISCRAHGIVEWKEMALQLPGRLGKQCRDRWLNHLDPTINKGEWTEAEDKTLAEAREQHGNAWATIAKLLPGRPENAIKNRWYSARRARERSVVAAPSGWDLRHEKQVIAHYAAHFAPDDALEGFLPAVTARLRARDPRAYDPSALPEVNRQKLQRRLWAALKREVARVPEGAPLRRAMLREKGIKLQGSQPQPAARAKKQPTATKSKAQAQQAQQAQPQSPHMAAVLRLLTDAISAEADAGKRALYRQALEATSKGSRHAVCFVEGVMGGGYAGLDLGTAADSEYLLGALASAVARGLFVC